MNDYKYFNKRKNAGGDEFGENLCVDIHCHCLPAIDDGPAAVSEAIDLCRAMAADGITTAIATPHQLGRFHDDNAAEQIREKVSVLNEELQNSGITLTIVPGGDVRVDERICRLLDDDNILTLADDGKYILLELPHQTFINIEPLLAELSSRGIQSIVSHPERHPVLAKQPGLLSTWFKHSTQLQITAASLLGEFGDLPQKAAWQFLNSGMAKLVATDCHNLTTRRPCMREAFERIAMKSGPALARQVCIENPLKVLNGQRIADVVLCGHKEIL